MQSYRLGGTRTRRVYEHIEVAEAALGKKLPPGAVVHHVDENKRNNAGRNLVICQDQTYHLLLHLRARVVQAGGDPNTQRLCGACKELQPLEGFSRRTAYNSEGRQGRCKACVRAIDKGRVRDYRKWRGVTV